MTAQSKNDEHGLSEREVLLSARLIVVEYGREASERVQERIADMKAAESLSGAHAWRRILDAVIGIQTATVK